MQQTREDTRAGPDVVPPGIQSQTASMNGHGGRSLESSTREYFESRFHFDFGSVRAHTGPEAASITRSLGARAFTVGDEIFFGAGEYQPENSAGRRLIAHELTHTIQQGASGYRPVGSGERNGQLVGISQRPAKLQRQSLTAPTTEPTDSLPMPIIVSWSGDRFQVSGTRTKAADSDRFTFAVHYLGSHKTSGPFVSDNTQRLDVVIADRPLNVTVVGTDATSITIDLYGDGSKTAKLIDQASVDRRTASFGRQHDLTATLDQQTAALASIWVLDPKATDADIVAPAPEEFPGSRPVTWVEYDGSYRISLDADGDGDKELELRFRATENWPDATYQDLVKILKIDGRQRTTGATRTVTFNIPRPSMRGSLGPTVKDVTDGHAPTLIDLVIPAGAQVLSMQPGIHTSTETRYHLSLGDQAADLVFPPDPAPERRIAKVGDVTIAGGILSADITLGAYNDRFRLTFRQMAGGDTTFGISALNGSAANGTMGALLNLKGPINYRVLDTGPVSLGVDLNGDGAPDLQIFDQLTTPADYDGGGPPARARNHRVRVTGLAIGAERTFDFRYRSGVLLGGYANPTAVDIEAGRNAEAVGALAAQSKAGGASDQLDQLEIRMLALRQQLVGRNLLAASTFESNQALWQALVRLRAQAATSVSPSLAMEVGLAARDFSHAFLLEVKNPSRDQITAAVTLTGSIKAQNWLAVMGAYTATVTALDDVLRDRIEASEGKGRDFQASKAMGQLRGELQGIPANAIRVAAAFHPDDKFRSDLGYVSTLPLLLYAWKDGGTWRLKDVTSPAKPFTYSADADVGQTGPPLALMSELNDPDHFPAGVINFQSPTGLAGRVSVEDHLTWKKFFAYLGLALAVAGVTLATAGAGTPVAVAATWALAASAVAGAVAAGIDLAEHIKHDNLDASTAVLDIAQIVAGRSGRRCARVGPDCGSGRRRTSSGPVLRGVGAGGNARPEGVHSLDGHCRGGGRRHGSGNGRVDRQPAR